MSFGIANGSGSPSVFEFPSTQSMPHSPSEYESLEEVEQFSSIFVVGMAFGYIMYGVAIIFGVPCNGFVLYRMYKFAKYCSDVFSNGTGVCLFAMAIADIISLVSICVHYVLSFGLIEFNPRLHSVICKLVIFSTHVSTSVSIWSWLLMSMLRYLSVYYPLVYIRLWRLPKRVLTITFGGAFLTNLWLLVVVTYAPAQMLESGEVVEAGGCIQMPLSEHMPELNRVFLFVEIFWSFCIPTATIVFVDSSVYLCRYSLIRQTKELEKNLRKNTCPQMKKNRKTLWRWLIIALIDVGLNAPENINRLAVILGVGPDPSTSSEFYFLMRVFSQLLYYLQFGFNGVYLALFIYDKSTRHAATTQNRNSRTIDKKTLEHEHLTLTTRTSETRPGALNNSFASVNSDEEHPITVVATTKGSKSPPHNALHPGDFV